MSWHADQTHCHFLFHCVVESLGHNINLLKQSSAQTLYSAFSCTFETMLAVLLPLTSTVVLVGYSYCEFLTIQESTISSRSDDKLLWQLSYRYDSLVVFITILWWRRPRIIFPKPMYLLMAITALRVWQLIRQSAFANRLQTKSFST